MNRLVPLMALPFLMQATLAHAQSCAEALKTVEQLYNNTVDQCVGANGEPTPASDCSGLMVRGTERPEASGGNAGDWYVWNDSPGVKERGTTAATFVRKDILNREIVVFKDGWRNYNSGYIVKSGPNEPKTRAACAAPADLWGDERADQGCGDNKKTAEIEQFCQDALKDNKTWVDTYFKPNMTENTEYIGGKSCTYNMRNMSDAERAQAFKSFLEARRDFQNVPNQDIAFNSYTEVRIPSTADNERPILAFHCTDNDSCADAVKNQTEYKQVTGKDVPIIKITFPKDKNTAATFSCDADPRPAPVPATGVGLTDAQKEAGGWGKGSDPKQCARYFDSVTWINRWDDYLKAFVDSVSAVPSECGRIIGPDQTDKAFRELEQKGKAAPGGAKKWSDRSETLRRQYVCHLALTVKDANGSDSEVRYKHEYNLEPVRPYVSHEQSIRDNCNSIKADAPVGGGGGGTPAQCPDYIKSVKWMDRTYAEYPGRKIKALEVTYNDCAFGFGPDKTAAVMAEMKKKALAADPQGAKYWGDKDTTMRRQSICLAQKYAKKNPVYVESVRPNEATQEQVNAADCNPK
ncbi:DUF2599 domain-containing protein [Pseudomonas sp. Marseille-P9899]|uniref:DUF2599 domain-containing protein n=1 Tax=Pseudomonas sp. Marseille-P9899 TaxID=2730401 RepID=UPI00158AF63D|nr:DUF2599 domain-containing protein [Pseudomonas sp. Marseille-P9899]